MAKYKKNFEYFLQEHQDHVAIHKLRFNKPVTPTDITELERILFESSNLGDKVTFEKAYGPQPSLGLFIRKIVGLDRKATEELFADYLKNTLFNSNQITFVTHIIDHLTQNGEMSESLLWEPPFTDYHSEGIDGVFKDEKVDEIINLIRTINKNAEIQSKMSL